MEEALNLFDEIANSYYFTRASIILFLNKVDLLQEKVLSGISRISTYYPDYTGDPRDVVAGQRFFFEKFKRRYRRDPETTPQKELYVHYTNATDTNLLKKTMDIVQNIVLRHNLTTAMLL
jgi:guanine nucleotide-binding protein subunit alpha, other